MDDLRILLDAPGDPASRLQIATLGDFNSGKYGDFSITRDDVDAWQRNLEHLPGQRALIDLDHQADRSPRRTEAAGWITNIGWDGDAPVADVEWTTVGKQAIEDKRYLFFSPTYGDHKNERGEVFENTLLGGALTNRPFLSGLPAITLASEENLRAAFEDSPTARLLEQAEETMRLLDALTSKQRDNLDSSDFAVPAQRGYPIHDLSHARNALARAGGKPEEAQVKAAVYKRYPQLKPAGKSLDSEPADSRAPDMPSEALLKLLDLGDDTDDAKLLETVTALKATADEANTTPAEPDEPVKTLEQQAHDAGLVILDQAAVADLQRKATAGETAMKHLHDQRFDTAFELALNDPRGARVTPAERDGLKHFYTLDADATLELIDARDPVVNAKPVGTPALELSADSDPRELMAAGQYPDSYLLDQKIRKHMLENKIPPTDYAKVLDQHMAGTVVL